MEMLRIALRTFCSDLLVFQMNGVSDCTQISFQFEDEIEPTNRKY